jgi:hypothetical protein
VFISTSPKETFIRGCTGHHYIFLILNNELDGPKEFIIKAEYLSSATDGIDAEINCVGSSTNQELQAYCEQVRTVRYFLRDSSRGLFRQSLTVSSNCVITLQTSKTSASSIEQ